MYLAFDLVSHRVICSIVEETPEFTYPCFNVYLVGIVLLFHNFSIFIIKNSLIYLAYWHEFFSKRASIFIILFQCFHRIIVQHRDGLWYKFKRQIVIHATFGYVAVMVAVNIFCLTCSFALLLPASI